MYIDLKYNIITQIILPDLEIIDSKNNLSIREVTIGIEYNPINCDCSVFQFLKYLHESNPYNKYVIRFEYKKLICCEPATYKGINLKSLQPISFLCEEKNLIIIPTNLCQKCICLLRPSDSSVLLNCSNKQLKDLHKNFTLISKYSKAELDFSSNNLTNIPDMKNEGYRSAILLNLFNNSISKIDNNILSPNLKVNKLCLCMF